MSLFTGLVFVTGGTGFLGGRVIERLVADGTAVRALVRRELPPHLANLGVELHHGDLVDASTLAGALDGVDTVIHCAGLVTDYAPYAEFMRVNGTGTSNLVDAGLAAGVRRFVHISTTDVYGYQAEPQSESDPVRTTGLGYNESKIRAEVVVRAAGERDGLPFTIIRPASIYGPRSKTFVEDFVYLLKKKQMVLFGDGGQDAGLAYVDNVVDLIFAAAGSDAAVGETYNACDFDGVTWQQYCDALADLVGCERCGTHIPYGLAYALGTVLEVGSLVLRRRRRPLLTRTAVKLLGIPTAHRNDKARAELGWQPRVSFAEALERIRVWLPESRF